MKVEPRLGTAWIRSLQWRRLRKQVRYVWERSPWQKKRWQDTGIRSPNQIRSLDDFRSRVPLFTKDDWRRSQEESLREHGHGLGMHLCVPRDKVRLLAATSGTTGEPTFYIFTEKDLETYCEGRARTFWRVGLRPGDTLLHAFGLGMFVGGVPNVLGAERFGLTVIPVGAEAGTERILTFAKLTRPRALLCTPSLARHLMDQSAKILGTPVKDLGIKVLLLGGEPGAGIPEVRRLLEQGYGARVFDLAGPTPSCPHPDYQGMHRITEDSIFEEIVDPVTRAPLPWEDGAQGELVVTQLMAEAAPWVRYATGDIHRIATSPCPCGLSGHRTHIVGRTDDMLKVKGVILYPVALKGVLTTFRPRITGELRIVLSGPPPLVEPPLVVKVERGEATTESSLPSLAKEIAEVVHERLKVRLNIVWTAPGSLTSTVQKTPFFERQYEKTHPPPSPSPQERGENIRVPFLSGVLGGDGGLVGGRCPKCGALTFPRRLLCPQCHAATPEAVSLSRRGKLFRFTISRMPLPNLPAPYALGTVELPEGVKVFARFKGWTEGGLRAGMEMEFEEAVLKRDSEGREVVGYVFRPVKA